METQISVVHSSPIWLPKTQTWMYNQIRFLPSEIVSHITCDKKENLDQFKLGNIHCLSDNKWRYRWELGLRRLRIRRHSGHLVQVAKREKAGILHSNFGNIGWANLRAARQARLKHIVSYYGLDVNYLPKQDPRWLQRYRRLFQEADRFLCEGPHMADCLAAMGCPREKISVHHLGVNLDEISFVPRTWRPGEVLKVLISATFIEKKGIPYALDAIGTLANEVPLEVTIIGDARGEGRSQAEKRRILDTIEQKNISSKIRMLGFQPHERLIEESYQHHVFLSPSVTASDGDTEGGAPVSIIEMAASGMIVISSRHADIPSIISHQKTGLLADERDVDGLVDCLRWVVNNPGEWISIQEEARRHISSEYDVRRQGERLAAIYQSVLAS